MTTAATTPNRGPDPAAPAGLAPDTAALMATTVRAAAAARVEPLRGI